MLVGDGQQIFVPTLPMAGMLRLKRGQPTLGESELADYAAATITALHPVTPSLVVDPPVLVTATAADTFDVGVRADLALGHPGLMDRLLTDLATQDGITAVARVAADAIEVHARGGDPEALQRWLTGWWRTYLPFDH